MALIIEASRSPDSQGRGMCSLGILLNSIRKIFSKRMKLRRSALRISMKNRPRVIFILVVSSIVFLDMNSTGFAIGPRVIKIGYTAPLTGPVAEYGTNGWRGILLALEDINKCGIMVGGKRYEIKVIPYDSVCISQLGVTNVLKMVKEDKVVAILGGHCNEVCNAVGTLCDKFRIPGITIECGADDVTKPGHEFYFRMRPPVGLMIPLIIPKIYKVFSPHTAGYLVVNDSHGRKYATSFEDELDRIGVKTVFNESFERGTTDFNALLTKIKKSRADMLLYVGSMADGARILKQAKELGVTHRTAFIGSEEMGEMQFILRVGPEAAEGTYAVSLWGSVPPEFKKRVKEKFGKLVHYGIIFGYDALHVVAKAIESAQSLDPVKIKDALKKTNYKALEGRIRFKDFNGYKNQCEYTPSVIRWENGKRIHLDIILKWTD